MAFAIVTLLSLPAAAADQESYYLGPDGFPYGELLLNPRGGELPNYDRGRDVEPGLLLERSSLGIGETDEARFQHWEIAAGETRLTGYPSVVIWSAADRFAPNKLGVFEIFLLDCRSGGLDCEEISSRRVEVDTGYGARWIESTVDFDPVDHSFGKGRYLAVRIVVSEDSDTDMIFAYGNTRQRSRLTVYAEPPIRPAPNTIAQTVATYRTGLPQPVPSQAPTETAQVVEPTVAVVSVGPWLITLFVSTTGLVLLGAGLMASLTRPGRHERLFDDAEPARSGLAVVYSRRLRRGGSQPRPHDRAHGRS